ncbi:hypothetical protein O181_015431 [Austropuccinia psidii MF-1]|uniref:Uncharacterized protein n=1 Tax=Austropuccinia psidii MF-1 TaxID=1389203 RepID=A0A9Q3C3R1_9BASI|nr:hypothetical protein [Austropuccinia psidii MF-1]
MPELAVPCGTPTRKSDRSPLQPSVNSQEHHRTVIEKSTATSTNELALIDKARCLTRTFGIPAQKFTVKDPVDARSAVTRPGLQLLGLSNTIEKFPFWAA